MKKAQIKNDVTVMVLPLNAICLTASRKQYLEACSFILDKDERLIPFSLVDFRKTNNDTFAILSDKQIDLKFNCMLEYIIFLN